MFNNSSAQHFPIISVILQVDEADYFVPDSHVLLNENHEVYDDINTSGDQAPNEIDLEKDDAKAPKEIDFNNPFGDVVTDEDGNELEVGTIEYFKKLGDRSKFDQRTRGAQLAEFRSLEQWVLKAKGADVWESFAQSALHPVEADCLLYGYIQTRFNKTEFKKVRLCCLEHKLSSVQYFFYFRLDAWCALTPILLVRCLANSTESLKKRRPTDPTKTKGLNCSAMS